MCGLLSAWALAASASAPASPAAGDAPDTGRPPAAAELLLDRIRGIDSRRLDAARRLAHSPAERELSAAAAQLARMQRQLAALRPHLARLDSAARPGIRAKLLVVSAGVASLLAAVERGQPVGEDRAAEPATIQPGAWCSAAPTVSEGAFAWQPLAAGSWFRYQPSLTGRVVAQTRGSQADTEVAVFERCGTEPLASADDGLQLAGTVGFESLAGDVRWIRVRAPVAPAPSTVQLAIDQGSGAIQGAVSEESSGAPLAGVWVRVYDAGGAVVAADFTDFSGNYTVEGLVPGSYFVATNSTQDLLDELWDDIPCDPDCDVTIGDPVAVSGVTGGIDFVLGNGGGIAGRVRRASDGVAVPGLEVEAFDASGSEVGSAFTDPAGRWELQGLAAGNYFARTANDGGYRDELWDDIPCWPVENCDDPTAGTPIPVALDAITSGIDFDLDAFGTISGVVTDVLGEPVPFAFVEMQPVGGGVVEFTSADALGSYRSPGLPDGDYQVFTGESDYLNEVFDDHPCGGLFGADCEPADGDAVPVSLGVGTDGVDFALHRLGRIAGRITAADTGFPLASVRVEIRDAAGFPVTDFSDSLGQYSSEPIAPDSYFVTAEDAGPFVAELYDDLPCFPTAPEGCDPSTGTPVAVALDADTLGVDLALARGGSIEGVVVDEVTGEGLTPTPGFAAFDAAGNFVLDGEVVAPGLYRVEGLISGTYFVQALDFDHIGELWNDHPCLPNCPPPTTGDPIAVTQGLPSEGIDFSLLQLGGLAGLVTDKQTGQPLAGVAIDVWDGSAALVATVSTDAAGVFQTDLDGDTGDFYVSTDNGLGYVDELWRDVQCPDGPAVQGLCDPLQGQSIAVDSSQPVATGVDFALGTAFFADGFESGDTSAWTDAQP